MSIHLHISPVGLYSKIAKEVAVVHDWLAGPPMSEHDRVAQKIVASEVWRRIK